MTVLGLERARAAESLRAPDDSALDAVALKAVRRVLDAWRLTGSQAAALIRESDRNWARKKKHDGSLLDRDQLVRASALIGIYRGLHDCFGPELADAWVSLPNTGPLFRGASPLNFMIDEGITGLLATREYIDAMRGGM
jgi:hypothetical protein